MKFIIRKILRLMAFLSVLLAANSVFAAEYSVLILKSAVQKTLRQNPQLAQLPLVLDGLVADRQSKALKPGFELGMDVENFAGTGEMNGFNTTETTIALSSALELGDKLQSRISIADAQIDRFELEKQVQTLDVLGELTREYIELLTTQEQQQVAAQAVELARALLNTVQKRAASGAASDAEVMRARAILNQAKLEQDSLQRKSQRQKVSLAKFWGATTPEFSSVNGNLYDFGEPVKFDDLYTQVIQTPAIEIFASEARLQDAKLQLAKSQSRADVQWTVGLKHFEESGDAAFTMGLSVPLNIGTRNQGQIKSAMAERDAVAYQRSARLLELHNQLFNAYSQRQQYVAEHQVLKTHIIPDLEKSLVITRESYDRGRLKYQDWIAAQQELLSARKQRIEVASKALVNQTVIEQLIAKPLTQAKMNID